MNNLNNQKYKEVAFLRHYKNLKKQTEFLIGKKDSCKWEAYLDLDNLGENRPIENSIEVIKKAKRVKEGFSLQIQTTDIFLKKVLDRREEIANRIKIFMSKDLSEEMLNKLE